MKLRFLKKTLSPLVFFAGRTNGQLVIQLINFLKSSFWDFINFQPVRKLRTAGILELFRVVIRNAPDSIILHKSRTQSSAKKKFLINEDVQRIKAFNDHLSKQLY